MDKFLPNFERTINSMNILLIKRIYGDFININNVHKPSFNYVYINDDLKILKCFLKMALYYYFNNILFKFLSFITWLI